MLHVDYYLSHPNELPVSLLQHVGAWLPDRTYLKWLYRLKMGRKLDLDHPKRYTEKLQWLKLYDRKPEYATMVDKVAVKEYVANIIGKEYVIPTLGVWDNPDEIDWNGLPDKFVLKTAHGGGGTSVLICDDKSHFDKRDAIRKLNAHMKDNVYKKYREWPYKYVPHRVLAEQLLEKDCNYNDIPDFKFYCFDGKPKVVLMATNRFTSHNFNYYDMDFKQLPIHSAVGGKTDVNYECPTKFDEMIDVSRKLSQGFAHIRVDLYCINNKIYFGELTFFDSSGYDNLNSDFVDLEWGSWISLPV
ncbi:MAG: glycosyl transferase [Bacteroidales bacterium]|nr:glycosyl transferase [Bacteroidales bacterium]